MLNERWYLDLEEIPALIALGQFARQMGDRSVALAHFQAAAARVPEDFWRKLDVVEELLALNRFEEAAAVCQAVLALEPGQPQALIALGQGARRMGDRSAALAHFQAAAARVPEDFWRKLDVVEELLALNRFEEAAAVCQAVLALEPGQPQALIFLGQRARRMGDRSAALAHFQAAEARVPGDIWRKLDVVEELLALERLDEAESIYREILICDPNFVAAKVGLGQLERRRRGAAASLAFFQAAITADPKAIWPYLEAAANLRDLGRLEEAEAQYCIVLAREPSNIYALIGRGYCGRMSNDRRAALTSFEQAVRHAPNDPWPRLEMAHEHREAGDHDVARQIAGRILQNDPNNLEALLSLAETERHAGQRASAHAILCQAHGAHPSNIDLLVEMARDEHRLGLHAACDAHLQRVLAKQPFHVGAIQMSADRLTARNEIEEARAFYDRARSARPNEPVFQLGFLTALCSLGRADEAIATIKTLQHQQDVPLSFLVKLIMMLRQIGSYHEALSVARSATEANPQSFWALLERFYTEILFDDDRSIEACLSMMRPIGRSEQAILERAWGLYEENRHHLEEAGMRYENAAKLDPSDPSPLSDLVRVKMMTGDFAGARQHLRGVSEREAYFHRLRQKSVNASQTFYGQILNDFSLDSGIAAALEALQSLPPPARLAVLRLVARQNPDSTAAAVSLSLAMQQSGAFDNVPSEGENIPKRIAQFWDSFTVPDDIKTLMKTWKEMNPDYEVHYFTNRTAALFLTKYFPSPVLQAFTRCREAAQKADIFRLAWLFAIGGIYVDADDRCLKPLDELLPEGTNLFLYQEDIGTFANDIIAATSNHSVIKTALDLAVTAINRGDLEIAWLSTGPGLITRAFVQFMLDKEADELLAGTVILNRRRLHQYVAIHCSAGYKNTNRHWLNSSFPSNGAGHSKSLDDHTNSRSP
jgi:tetratricopeptide (TPR) repeat protein